jgi:hypothetical protein
LRFSAFGYKGDEGGLLFPAAAAPGHSHWTAGGTFSLQELGFIFWQVLQEEKKCDGSRLLLMG